jgi:hypothetical protein
MVTTDPMDDLAKAGDSQQQDSDVDTQIARRAYELSQSDESGSDEENWLRAERELRGQAQSGA